MAECKSDVDCQGNAVLGHGKICTMAHDGRMSHGSVHHAIGSSVPVNDPNILIDCCVESLFEGANIVFDPGGGDRDALFGFYGFSSPTADQYFDLLLLDRGEL